MTTMPDDERTERPEGFAVVDLMGNRRDGDSTVLGEFIGAELCSPQEPSTPPEWGCWSL